MSVNQTEPGRSMSHDWDARARGDWRYFVAAHACSSEEAFRASGEHDYERFVRPLLRETGIEPSRLSVMEIGCGAGRMTEFFARDFRRVVAVDASRGMLALARRRVPAGNVLWVCSDGTSLSGIADQAVDFVFSYKVLQHILQIEVVENYVREASRVTKAGGWVKFQVMNHPHIALGSRMMTFFVSRRFHVPRFRIYTPNSFDAVPVSLHRILQICRASSFSVERVSGRLTQNAWVSCRKA